MEATLPTKPFDESKTEYRPEPALWWTFHMDTAEHPPAIMPDAPIGQILNVTNQPRRPNLRSNYNHVQTLAPHYLLVNYCIQARVLPRRVPSRRFSCGEPQVCTRSILSTCAVSSRVATVALNEPQMPEGLRVIQKHMFGSFDEKAEVKSWWSLD